MRDSEKIRLIIAYMEHRLGVDQAFPLTSWLLEAYEAAKKMESEATEKIFGSSQINNRKADLAMLSEESAVGAALMLTYLRDCFTVTPKENFDRPRYW